MSVDKKQSLILKLLENVQNNIDQLRRLVSDNELLPLHELKLDNIITEKPLEAAMERGSIIEGVFNGQHMVGPDGKIYTVPPNYASKSKLVEGDILKLTISPDGTFIYKQIQPIERDRLVGTVVKDKETDEYRALVEKRLYKLLLASVTYFKGDVGDQVVILVPKEGKSSWAAVENIIK